VHRAGAAVTTFNFVSLAVLLPTAVRQQGEVEHDAVGSTLVARRPDFSLCRQALLAARLTRFRGILNSTTNLILTEMRRGNSFEAAVKKAQHLGVAEAGPSFDGDGW
jgi:homoserine dehydrogenase